MIVRRLRQFTELWLVSIEQFASPLYAMREAVASKSIEALQCQNESPRVLEKYGWLHVWQQRGIHLNTTEQSIQGRDDRMANLVVNNEMLILSRLNVSTAHEKYCSLELTTQR
jgi:hypothetical protein